MSQTNDDEMDDSVEPKPFWKRPKVLLLIGVGVAAILFIFSQGPQPTQKKEAAKSGDDFIGQVVPYSAPRPDPPPTPDPPTEKAPPQPPPPPPQPSAPAVPAPPNFRAMMPNQTTAPPQKRGVMMSYSVPHYEPPKPPAGSGQTAQAPPETGVDFKAVRLPGAKASAAFDDTYVLRPGLLPCVLDTAISSDAPNGDLMCHLPGPVYSPKGVLLMEAGTQILGRYEGLKGGGNRLQAISTYAITPNGIYVPITGNMTDNLGRNGLEGDVDHRLMERFGAAIALTLTESALKIIQAQAGSGGNTYLNLNSGGGGIGSIAQQILQSTIGLPPIFSKPQGTMIAIFLSIPTDFSGSYRIKEVRQ